MEPNQAAALSGSAMTSPAPRSDAPPATPEDARPGLKLLIDFAPLLVFFVSYRFFDIFWATGVLVLASLVALVLSRIIFGRIAPALAVSTTFVVGFGVLAVLLRDPTFIKIKPTAVYLLFAALLAFGLWRGQIYLRMFFEQAFRITDAGWRTLTFRWIGFFLFKAALNEVIWRNWSEPAWVNFKTFGILPLTFAFVLMQIPLIKRTSLDPSVDPAKS